MCCSIVGIRCSIIIRIRRMLIIISSRIRISIGTHNGRTNIMVIILIIIRSRRRVIITNRIRRIRSACRCSCG